MSRMELIVVGKEEKSVNNKAHLYPQNSTFGLLIIERYSSVNMAGTTHFFMSIHRRAFPSVWVSLCIWYVAADKSDLAPSI